MPGRRQIVVISGMAPIFASKVRAWEEPMLVTRIGAAPVPPQVQIAATSKAADASALALAEAARSMEAADMDALPSMELEDFAVDFSGLEVPQGELSAAEIERLATAFIAKATGEDDTRPHGRDPGA